MKKNSQEFIIKLVGFVFFALISYQACREFYEISWGTGNWWGEFSLKWGVAFVAFVFFSILCLIAFAYALNRSAEIDSFLKPLIELRGRMGFTRWLVSAAIAVLPIWLLQYSSWGVIIGRTNLRLLIWFFMAVFLAFFATADKLRAWSWPGILAAFFMSAAGFSLFAPLKNVTAYPFSLGWSEGNRMWDYSLLFGSARYDYPPDNPPVAYLDLGRQLSGGLPFLFPNLTILQERLWLGLMWIIPYVILGWTAFRLPNSASKLPVFLAGLWAWLFLTQGPIHAPLLWCAVLVALAWSRSLWLGIPLVALSAYLAAISRSTWVFAPAMWSVMLEIGSGHLEQFRLPTRSWWRAVALGLAGLAGGPFSPTLISIGEWLRSLTRGDMAVNGAPSISPGTVTVSSVTSAVTDQPLLWYRLFPNATFGNGILLGLLIAVLPVIITLVYLYLSRNWVLNLWQRLVIILPLFAFLVVGLIVSTKIGGGGDLHNMDMFLIGIMFTAALAWRGGGAKWLGTIANSPQWVRIAFLLMVALPGFNPLKDMFPISFEQDAEWLMTIADVETLRALGSLPSNDKARDTLDMVREYVNEAQMQGEVLFMDQRQLLTFGYIRDVRLVWEYEKKLMMDKALSSDAAYFQPFYRDLAARRFSLIISDPLRAPIKDSDYQFGEENNAWVKWVAVPVLCYYEPIKTVPEFRLQLLAPAQENKDCSRSLPEEAQ